MQPSSLIFLVLVLIWAAYLLQHWVRRREYLATARSVDRFSDAMRVLQRPTAVPEPDLSMPRPPSYAGRFRPGVAERRAQSVRPEVRTEPAAAVRTTRTFRILARMSARRLRGFSLLAAVSLALAAATLVAVSVLPWWSILVALVVLVADVAVLRHAAVSRRRNGRTHAQETESARPTGSHPDDWDADIDTEYERQSGIEARFEPGVESESEPSVAEIAEVAEPFVPAVEDDPSGWAPVPVPPPTYTLKAKAADPVLVPVALPEPAPGEPWSLDGLFYDCELEDLVERRSATGA